jgi:hypothetical protein
MFAARQSPNQDATANSGKCSPRSSPAENRVPVPVDYLLRVVAPDLNDYAALRDHKLATLPGVQRITSTIVMKRIIDNRPLPLPGTRSRKVRGAATTSGRQGTSSRGRRA